MTKQTPAAEQAPAPVSKPQQLKKQDFLSVIDDKPMTREDIVNALSEYTFIGSYLDYLTEHFLAQGKIVRNEDGTVQRKGKKPSPAHEVYRVVVQDEVDEHEELTGNQVYALESKTLEPGEKMNKDAGWAATPNRAVKNMTSSIFADYQANTKAVRALLEEPAAE